MTTDKKIEFYTLADAYKKTGNPRFLAKMRKMIERDDRRAMAKANQGGQPNV